jgi:signal transduction histidine kinase
VNPSIKQCGASFVIMMRRLLSISLLLPAVTGLMTVALVTVFAIYAALALESREAARRVPLMVDISYDLFAAVQTLRTERGTVNTALATQAPADAELQSDITELRVRSAQALQSALRKLDAIRVPGIAPAIEDLRKSGDAIAALRPEIDGALQRPIGERPAQLGPNWIASNGKVVFAIDHLSHVLESELSERDSFIAEMIRAKQIIWSLRSYSGDDRLLVREAMVRGTPLSDTDKRQFAFQAGRIEGAWNQILDQAKLDATPQRLKDAIHAADTVYFSQFRSLRDSVVEELSAGRPVHITPRDWYSLSNPGRESIYMVAKTAFDLVDSHASEQVIAAERHLYIAILLMALFCGIGVLTATYVIKGVVGPITRIAETMHVVANGNLTGPVPFEERTDEIGLLARALCIFRDNAIEKQQLHLAKVSAETANRTKSEFLANMSHELRTPLNAILGYSEIIKRGMFGPLSARYREYGADVFDSGTHLLNLINDILDLSKLEAGQFELQEEVVDFASAIEACIHLLEPQADNLKVGLSTQSAAEGKILIRADERRLRQILINLVSNAVKFTPEGGHVCIATSITDQSFIVAVSDTGIGMAPADIPKALEPFRQVDSKLSRKYQGTGLGLPLAKHLTELHGGTLTIESEVNAGTTVRVAFPLERLVQPLSARATA